jgi:heme A synthase
MSSATIPQPSSAVAPSRALSRFAVLTLGFMVIVILEGAIVRATGSGAGCGNHWPLCNGDFFPHHPRLATIIEYVHRSLTAVITILVAALIAWTFVATPRGDRSRRAAVCSGLLLITEAFLGAVLVLGGYVETNASNMRVLMQCVHFTNTMLLMAALTLTWWWLSPRRQLGVSTEAARRIAWVALAATILVGATGSVAALADTLAQPRRRIRTGLRAHRPAADPHALAAPRRSDRRPCLRLLAQPAPAQCNGEAVAHAHRRAVRTWHSGRAAPCPHLDAGAAPAGSRPVLDRPRGRLLAGFVSGTRH